MKQLSVIILTYNSEKDIYQCLESVYQYNDIGEDLEVIVVDNQSKDFATMQQEIAKRYPQVIITQNTHNGGYGQGNNVGIRIATAPVVAIMNPDIRLMQPIFAAALQTLDNKDVIMCAGKQMHSPTQLGWSYAFDYNALSFLQVPLRNIYKRFDYYDYRHMHLSGAFFFIKKACFEQIGMFDEQIFMYGEECDIHLRLRKAFPKKQIQFLPIPICIYRQSDPLRRNATANCSTPICMYVASMDCPRRTICAFDYLPCAYAYCAANCKEEAASKRRPTHQ